MPDTCEAWWQTHYGDVERLFATMARQHKWLRPPFDFCHTLKAQYAQLVRCGADPDFVDRVLSLFAQDPRHRFVIMLRTGISSWPNRRAEALLQRLSWQELVQRHEELGQVVPTMEAVERLVSDPSFSNLSAALQAHLLSALYNLHIQFKSLIVPLYEAWQRADADPLVLLLEQDRPAVRRRGRPSRQVGTAVMALISRHLHARTGRSHARVVGEVTHALFPGVFAKKARKPAGWSQAHSAEDHSLTGVEERVGDRLRKFRYDLDALVAALG
jgi:hypothetical protein